MRGIQSASSKSAIATIDRKMLKRLTYEGTPPRKQSNSRCDRAAGEIGMRIHLLNHLP